MAPMSQDGDSIWISQKIQGPVPGVVVRWATVPPALRRILERYIPALAPLVPSWCHEIRFIYDATDSDGFLSVTGEPEYRRATVTILPAVASKSPDEMGADLCHEFVHLANEPLMAVFHALVKALEDHGTDKTLLQFAKEQMTQALEGVVCDYTRILHPLLVDNSTR